MSKPTSTEMPAAPDKFNVRDRGIEAGLHWITANAPLWGAVNGYVHVPEGHPLHGLDYDSISNRMPDLSVNGGLTFGADDGWVGFDTLHAGDVWPECPEYGQPNSWDKHWTPEMVAEETRSLARQLAAYEPGDTDLTDALTAAFRQDYSVESPRFLTSLREAGYAIVREVSA